MLTLNHLPPPPSKDEVTACENEGQLISFPSEEAKLKIFEWLGNYNVEVSIGQENARSAYSKYEAKEAFSAHNETLWQRLVAAYYEEGAMTVFQQLSQEAESRNPIMRKGVSVILKLLEAFERVKIYLHSPSGTPLHLSDISVQAGSGSVIKLAWHPHTSTLAVVYADDTIRVFGKNRSLTPLLKHRLQKQITHIEWMPNCASILAVGCQSGILLWTLDPISVVTRPSGSCLSSLSHPSTLPLSSLSWHPKGLLVACVGAKGRELIIWDTASEEHCTVHSGVATCISKVIWSPDGNRLLAAMSTSGIKVFECRNWSFEKWSLSYPLQTAVWSKCGRILLFATTKEPFLFSLSFGGEDETGVCGALVATQVADLSACIHTCGDGEEVRVGGPIKRLAWDNKSERLAVLFKDSEFIALFHTYMNPVLHLAPGGFIRGELGQYPLHISFQNNVSNGSILTTVWSGGEVKHLPLRYTSHCSRERYPTITQGGNHSVLTSPAAGNLNHSRMLQGRMSPIGSPLPRLFTSPT